jgi:enoyl-[acyl-carrier-protein] reductase (NADH)
MTTTPLRGGEKPSQVAAGNRGLTLDELGRAAVYLLSDLSTGVTGEIHFVDSGYNVIAMPQPDALRADAKQTASSGN